MNTNRAYEERTLEIQRRMTEERIDILLLTDPDTVYYVSGFWGYLGMEFGRPTVVIVPQSGSCTLITPSLEAEMARAMIWFDDIREWTDGVGEGWVTHLRDQLGGYEKPTIGIERLQIPPLVSHRLRSVAPGAAFVDISGILMDMRMVKSPEEIEIMRQAGRVAVAMAEAAGDTIGEGVPEYEVSLAVIAAGTRKAAEFLDAEGPGRLFSPTIRGLPILQSGPDLSMVHRQSTVRRIQRGDAVYLCFCELARFKQFKLGFDREFFVGTVSDEHARIYEVALRAQAAALGVIRPGVLAAQVHAAAEEVYREAGFGPAYRTGRGIGYSFLEKPELKPGDRTPLQTGMTLAVDGGITVPGQFGARVGDSVVVTETGFEYLTPYSKELRIL
ncbi:MAG: M24 family metallopeptidase [bacterium]